MSDAQDETPDRGIKIADRRRWAAPDSEAADASVDNGETPPAAAPGDADLEALRARAEAAERKLYEFSAAFQRFRDEQDQIRARLERDVDRKTEIRFGALVADLLDAVDDLDLALDHAKDVAAAAPLAQGVAIARDRFVTGLLKNGVERLDLEGAEFDPNLAEAVAVVAAEDPALDGRVVRTVRTGYRLGERVIRPARVLVGRAQS